VSERPLAAVVVAYRSEACIGTCVDALLEGATPARIMVWDNASPDGSAKVAWARSRDIDLVRSETNLGFAAAVNRAAERVPGHDLLLVNPDATLERGAVESLVAALAMDPRIAVAGCRLRDPGGGRQPDAWRFPSPLRTVAGAALGLGRMYSARPRRHGSVDIIDDGFVPFTAALLRRPAFDTLEGLDEAFWLYGEDADYCYRARSLGWWVVVVPDAVAVHQGGASSEPDARAAAVLRGGDRFRQKHFSAMSGQAAADALRAGAWARLNWAAIARRFTPRARSRSEWRHVRRHYRGAWR